MLGISVLIDQHETEARRCHKPIAAIQEDLADDNGNTDFLRISLSIGVIERQLAIIIDSCLCAQNAITVGYHNGHSIHHFIISNALCITLDFDNCVCMGTGCGVLQSLKGKCSICSVLHGLQNRTILIDQLEGEFASLQFLTNKGLGTTQVQLSFFRSISIVELQLTAIINGRLRSQNTGFCILANNDGYCIDSIIVGNIRIVTLGFADLISERTSLGKLNGFKLKAAVSLIRGCPAALTVGQNKGEHTFFQCLCTGQVLGTRQNDLNAIRCEGIHKLQNIAQNDVALVAAVDSLHGFGCLLHRNDRLQLAAGRILLHLHGYIVNGFVILDVVIIACQFLHHVVIGTLGAVFDHIEAEAAVCQISYLLDWRFLSGKLLVRRIQREGKFACCQLPAIQCLLTDDSGLSIKVVNNGDMTALGHFLAIDCHLAKGYSHLVICTLCIMCRCNSFGERVGVTGRNLLQNHLTVFAGYANDGCDLNTTLLATVMGQGELCACQRSILLIDLLQC